MRGWVLVFYTAKPKESEVYGNEPEDMKLLFDRIVQLTKNKAKFIICEIGNCVGDYS